MQRVRTHGAVMAGAALTAMALSLAACSSSSSSSGGGSSSSSLSGTLNASGSTFQLTFQQTAIQSFKSVQPNMTINYGGGGSGKGRTDLASGVVEAQPGQFSGWMTSLSTAGPSFMGRRAWKTAARKKANDAVQTAFPRCETAGRGQDMLLIVESYHLGS